MNDVQVATDLYSHTPTIDCWSCCIANHISVLLFRQLIWHFIISSCDPFCFIVFNISYIHTYKQGARCRVDDMHVLLIFFSRVEYLCLLTPVNGIVTFAEIWRENCYKSMCYLILQYLYAELCFIGLETCTPCHGIDCRSYSIHIACKYLLDGKTMHEFKPFPNSFYIYFFSFLQNYLQRELTKSVNFACSVFVYILTFRLFKQGHRCIEQTFDESQ